MWTQDGGNGETRQRDEYQPQTKHGRHGYREQSGWQHDSLVGCEQGADDLISL
jgi:hypothetical protein